MGFILLAINLIFFNKAYRQLTAYSKLTNRNSAIQNYYQILSQRVNNAAVINPELINASNSLRVESLFFTDSLAIIQQLNLLKTSVQDSINLQITGSLDKLIRSELSWLLSSNVPDSIIKNKAADHIASLTSIDSLIKRGIQRTNSLLEYGKTRLNEQIRKVRMLIILFVVLSVMLLIYTTTIFVKQQTKTKRKEKELETVFNRINDSVVSVDNNWRYTFLNDIALSTHPLGKKETLGKVIWDVHPEMRGTIFWEKYHEAMQTKKVVEIEDYYAPMDIWFLVKVYPSSDGLTIFYKDISKSKKAEQHLLQSLKDVSDYKFALDESSIVAITDHKGTINHVNNNFCKISKYSADELIGQDHRIINSGYHSKEFIKNLWATIAKGRIWKGELKNKAKDGTVYWVDTTIVPFLNKDGKPYQYVAIRADITERKEAEENLKESLREIADYKYAIDESSIVAITDQKGIINYVNENFCKISKYAAVELIGQDHRIINSGYHPKEFIKNLWTTIARGKIWKGELKNKAKDGAIYWVDTTIVPFLDDKGKPYQYVAIRADITERKKAEENLAYSEMHFRALIENSAEGITLTDEFSNVIYRSQGSRKITGILPEKNAVSLTHPEDLQLIKNKHAELLTKPGVPIEFQARFLHASGKYIWLEGTFTNLLNVKEVNAIVTNYRDITQRKEAEQKLIKSEKIYKTIASSLPGSVICLLDADYRYFLIEGDMLKKLGYSKEKLLGNKAEDVLPPEVFLQVQPEFKKAFEGITVTREANMNDYDIISRYIPLMDENNSVYAIMTATIDVTQLKNAQRDISDLNRGLEEKIKVRTEQLKKSNEELEAFSYSVSHDLRAPLRAIIAFAKILEEEYTSKLDNEAKRITFIIRDSTLKMGNLIDDLLAFSRMGKQGITKVQINTDLMVREIIDEQKQSNKDHDSIDWDIRSLPSVLADMNMLRQVWINLISNAIKYSGNKEQPHIEIGSYRDNGQVVFYIRDNGAGFDEEYKDKLFKVFQRLHDADEFEGTGIGLALVEKIISRHEGKVWAEGKEGEGACFYFSLPKKLFL